MDVLSHFFIPFIVALFILGLHKRPTGAVDIAGRETRIAYAVVFGLAGLAPDLDSALSWARHGDGLYWLQHRGVSHTLIGAPFFAAITTAMLHGLAHWRPARFGRYRFRPGFIPVTLVGAWSHLLLDLVTYGGVPALWPFSFERFGLNIYHWIIVWMFPLVASILGLHLWGKIRVHHVAWCGVFVVAAFVIVAGARFHYMPEVDPSEGFGDPDADGLPGPFGVQVYSRNSIFEYTVVWPVPGGWMATLYDTGRWTDDIRFYGDHRDAETDEAIRSAQDTNAYRGFLMGVFGPVVTDAVWLDDDTVQVVFTDVAARFEADQEPRWTPAKEDTEWGYVVFHVTGDRVESVHAGW